MGGSCCTSGRVGEDRKVHRMRDAESLRALYPSTLTLNIHDLLSARVKVSYKFFTWRRLAKESYSSKRMSLREWVNEGR